MTGQFTISTPKRKVQVEGGSINGANLIISFTFDIFIEGKSNQLAHCGRITGAENPGGGITTLCFFNGGVGLGKKLT